MKVVTLEGQERKVMSKSATKALRKEELVPAVMYGGDDVLHFSVSARDVRPLIYTSDFKVAEVNVNGNAYRCILKDKQFHPVSDEIQHLDFLQLTDGATVRIQVPIRFTGSAPGVKVGGKLQQNLRLVKIKTTPENMVYEMTADVSKLELGQSIRVRDIKTVEGVEIMNSPSIPIATIEIPRALRSAASAAAAAAK
ncbi:50S ribosomal protein L25 [Flavilitoribacter nigricans]|uniref:Large ribosomal subunit protein bL25 n=1 Tax=Flavilitoribacter nigricans (strain ATCC 23147 / DSM 23189 / NBRC 102662 / NCIMB 1420 / SS-2) TaxID=1122177 RepID=A0A2D0MXJ7_FLAN2|nr:50S ribosomal protein L25 [Flavilitoribacter nigricans]PHN01002.1 50S ribosomal protein L25 [Flavilitoribacter nigricans DSM 23189 = NBRC 102662]